MLRPLTPYGRDSTTVRSVGNVAFGLNLTKTLPEDEFDLQPLEGGEGRFLLVADARVDNRAELARTLGLEARAATTTSDAALLMAAWERWELAGLDHVLGDYAFGVWDREDSSLTLVRSPFALKPLFYHTNPRFTAFASMPAGLHAIEAIPKRINLPHAAAVVAEHTYLGSSTMFGGIMMVRPGHAVRLKSIHEETHRIWNLERNLPEFKNTSDWGEALRAELERAVAVRLRRHHGAVAAHLSSGRDSSAVATTAARLLASQSEKLQAYTGAPREGFSGPSLRGWLADESELAARTAAQHPNIRHFVIRPEVASVLRDLRLSNALHYGPMLGPSNLPWWAEINRQAAANGATVMLLGSMGNFSISAGGADQFGDLMADAGVARWALEAIRSAHLSPIKWRAIANVSFGPQVPRRAYQLLMQLTGRWSSQSAQVPLLRSPHRKGAEKLLEQDTRDPRPSRSFTEYRREMLLKHDNSEQVSLGEWNIDARDPTVDRRLVEMCFAMPVEQLISSRSARPAFERAFGDRIPEEVLASTRRGYQGADWFELFPKQGVRECFEYFGRNTIVRDLLDLDYINGLIDAWPSAGWDRRPLIYTYRNKLLGALSLASFIDLHFPD
ncbi:MAG: asparagine synthetase B family protein [Sphingomicrobium sp.]